MPAPHALYSKMLAEQTASRNVLVLFYFVLFVDYIYFNGLGIWIFQFTTKSGVA